ncbi:hypothetical protein BX600DRAFT_441958 [Xylariales sp. PMI_506]|nr:hypothetical protein BX600DRAFT_441958 [Xylariales sp. PMI_506]
MAHLKTSILEGSWVLVTGATGSLASHTVKQLLERGFRVRGTVRDLEKSSWLTQDVFKSYADRGDFEVALVPNLAADHAFDDAVKGVSAIAHIASIVNFDPDPNKVVTGTVVGTTSLLEAALKEPSVKAFAYTSSFLAATMPAPGNTTVVGRDTWNDFALQAAWAPPPYEPTRAPIVYAASKAAAEKALWKFFEEKKPHFTLNVISPSGLFGEPLHKSQTEHGAAWMKMLYLGETAMLGFIPANIYVNVKDAALLHVASILDPTVNGKRIQAWAGRCNWNDMLSIGRKLYPQHKFVEDLPGLTELSISADSSDALLLLKKWADQDGWKSLEETVADSLRPLPAWYD